MQKFPKISIMLCLVATLFFACSKDHSEILPNNAENTSELFENDILTNEDAEAATRGNCGSYAVSVEYEGKVEYEFDVAFQGYTTVHFFNNPSGTMKTRDDLPVAVQNRMITLQNKPTVKQNPKCPWMSAKGTIKIKIFNAQKDNKGAWIQVPGTTAIEYILGEKAPSQTLMGGTRVFCVDKPIGKWYFCSFYLP
jgi:hypothetical protein